MGAHACDRPPGALCAALCWTGWPCRPGGGARVRPRPMPRPASIARPPPRPRQGSCAAMPIGRPRPTPLPPTTSPPASSAAVRPRPSFSWAVSTLAGSSVGSGAGRVMGLPGSAGDATKVGDTEILAGAVQLRVSWVSTSSSSSWATVRASVSSASAGGSRTATGTPIACTSAGGGTTPSSMHSCGMSSPAATARAATLPIFRRSRCRCLFAWREALGWACCPSGR
mmetsp:Transcript_97992/g.258852  ORF Transcript_97992/g.258852 Transcript_97992/m.258852 type:complete len:226 (-) Transcript_97992:616-1293(-)